MVSPLLIVLAVNIQQLICNVDSDELKTTLLDYINKDNLPPNYI